MTETLTEKRVQRAITFALQRSTPFSTVFFVRAVYGLDMTGMSRRVIQSYCKSATRVMAAARPRLAAQHGGSWFCYDKKTSTWRARGFP